MHKEIIIKIDENDHKLFSSFDPNPIHKKNKNNRSINGCVSGLLLLKIANEKTWSNNVFCATDIQIKFYESIYPNDICNLKIEIKEYKNNREVIFTFIKNHKICTIGKIKQLLTDDKKN